MVDDIIPCSTKYGKRIRVIFRGISISILFTFLYFEEVFDQTIILLVPVGYVIYFMFLKANKSLM